MKPRPRHHSWFGALKAWHQLLIFLIAIGTVATALFTVISTTERTYGLIAHQLGFTTTTQMTTHRVEHKGETDKILTQLDRISLWQLYDQIKRTQRQIDILEERKTPNGVEREQLRDLKVQLEAATTDYKEQARRVREQGR